MRNLVFAAVPHVVSDLIQDGFFKPYIEALTWIQTGGQQDTLDLVLFRGGLHMYVTE